MNKRTKKPRFVAYDGRYDLTFPDGTRTIHDAPGRDTRGGMPGMLTAYDAHGQQINIARLDIFNAQQRRDFALDCEATHAKQTAAAWIPRLVIFTEEIRKALNHGPPPLPLPAAPAPFPLDVLPLPLQTFVEAVAKALPCPADYVAVPLLPVLGAAIGTTATVQVKPGWQESALLWSGVVDEPGSKKSPALSAVMQPLYAIQRDMKATYTQQKRDYDSALAAWEAGRGVQASTTGKVKFTATAGKPEAPVFPQICSTDATVESLAGVLEHNPRGILFVRDELSGWTLGMNAYKGGKGADRQHWLSFWNSSPVIVNRKSQREPIILEHPFVAVTGCMPPDVLGELADARGREDGFVNRLLLACPAPHTLAWTEDAIDASVTSTYEEIIRHLVARTAPEVLHFTDDAKQTWNAWVTRHYQEMASPDLTPGLRGPWGKLDGTCARLALILQLTRAACDTVTKAPTATQPASTTHIDTTSMTHAITLIEDYFKSHLRQIYSHLRTTSEDLRLLAARQTILRQGGTITLRDIYRNHIAGCTTQAAATKFADMMVEHGLGRLEERTPPHGGHQYRVLTIHP